MVCVHACHRQAVPDPPLKNKLQGSRGYKPRPLEGRSGNSGGDSTVMPRGSNYGGPTSKPSSAIPPAAPKYI
eukprot:1181767-Prorocentrum_minimum.AAC.2